jgi:hypothetical protein
MTNMESTSKWSCTNCNVVIPYNPQYDMSNMECSNCAAYSNADKLLGGYRLKTKTQILLDMKRNKTIVNIDTPNKIEVIAK